MPQARERYMSSAVAVNTFRRVPKKDITPLEYLVRQLRFGTDDDILRFSDVAA